MQAIEKVRDFLKEKESNLKIIELDADTSTSELAAQALGTEVGQIAKSILFKTKKDDFLMIVAAGDVKLDFKAIKDLAGARIRMANSDEVKEVTGYDIGGVCPFALNIPVKIYIDESLTKYDVVYAAAGTANTALPITFNQLLNITDASPCNVSFK
ncbi:Hypothetical protein SYNTR_1597 [Candidatus Syntrophocurvum alkaliphilum]|uniref:YbaK/aminoacyl-tRNA synthetase-associated domain-containing protein n=1 Tax=Candidatus Syntrophocurvum alkaliphilum TaxID=2293317 RepID=A0A6I6DJ45_9FIRM|nr:YbaK/EbsC family protein [Candidatus Syntrophocurvum alkaliphilum]QGU00191.1 Hypothetical protein SYNTR_1597 [Candidatus Syntrophocurvum alkaliphilum]